MLNTPPIATTPSSDSIQDNEELTRWLQLALTPRVGAVTINKLLKHFGSISNIFCQSTKTIAQVIENNTVASIITNPSTNLDVDKALAWLNSDVNNHIITLTDKRYPKELLQLADRPAVLYLKGNIELLAKPKLAIVGTRHPSLQGIENASAFAKELSKLGITIVSGMASGIDRHAHIGAMSENGKTIGVIGTGIEQIYPNSNKDIFAQVQLDGLLISEYPLDTPPVAGNFPRRNRIIAGLSHGCLVVESALDGGSMITANLALENGREVMAIPGSIHNKVAGGCHKLIKTGAKLVESIHDILEELPLITGNAHSTNIYSTKTSSQGNIILDIIGYDPISIDKICAVSKLNFEAICPMILELELSGQITNCGNGNYQRSFN